MTRDITAMTPGPNAVVLAVSSAARVDDGWLRDLLAPIVPDAARVQVAVDGTMHTAIWDETGPVAGSVDGSIAGPVPASAPIVLSRGPRLGDRELTAEDLSAMTAEGSVRRLTAAMPPFAALAPNDGGTASVVVDAIGFRHVYRHDGPSWSAVCTSARVLSKLAARSLDREALAVQSLLGWQVGGRTPFRAVSKVPAGAVLTLGQGTIAVECTEDLTPGRVIPAAEAVSLAADAVRQGVGAFLDDHPDAVLQLTGGLDSRILLAAIPPSRRREVSVMTLDVPGGLDAPIARELASRYGMDHDRITMDGLEDIDPAEAYARCVAAAGRLECSADPLAFAALDFAESAAEPRPRISGLGGEVARGFYYFGPVHSLPVTRERVARLTSWRLIPNEGTPREMFEPEFRRWAVAATVGAVHRAFLETGKRWFDATDEFYLKQRMQRWAGVLATARCLERTVVNPMLDHRFLGVIRSVPAREKKNALTLSRILLALDPELAGTRMDGRPPPAVYARGGPSRAAKMAAVTGRKALGKARQRLGGERRPPVGGQILAGKVVQFWRSRPEVLDAARGYGILAEPWLDDMLRGRGEPEPSAVAFLVNLLASETGELA